MKKLHILLLSTLMCVGLSACSTGDNSTSSSDTVYNPFASKEEKDSESNETANSSDEILVKIEDYDWKVEEGIYEGERKLLFSYTNNSDYDMLNFKIKFSLKPNLTEENMQLFKVFTYGSEDTQLTNEEMQALYIGAPDQSNILIKAGSSLNPKPCHMYGEYGLNGAEDITLDQYNLMEPDMAIMQYITNDKIHLVYYDFKNKNYTLDEIINIYEWSNGTLASMIPKAEVKVGEIVTDNETVYKFRGFGSSKQYFSDYINECKDKGFTNVSKETKTRYEATNSEGYKLSVSYYDSDDEFTVRIDKPKEQK